MSVAAGGGGKRAGVCKLCGKEGNVMQCSKCHKALYCGPVCQKEDWKEHKVECPRLAKEYACQKDTAAGKKFAEGSYEESQRRIEKALLVQREQQGRLGDDSEGDRQLARSMVNLGVSLYNQGKLEEGLQKLLESLHMLLDVCGHDHELTAQAYGHLGIVYTFQERYDLANAQLKEALTIQLKLLGNDHPDVACTRESMASVRLGLGDYPGALKSYELALRIKKEHLGDEHEGVATTLHNMAAALVKANRLDEALGRFNESLRIGKKALGDSHPTLAQTCDGIADVHQKQHNFTSAIESLSESLRISHKGVGPEHPHVARTLYNMSCLYLLQNDAQGALTVLREALRITEKSLEEGLPQAGNASVGSMCERIGQALNMLGQFEEAQQYLERAASVQRRAFGAESKEAADAQYNLARCYDFQGCDEKAQKLYRKCVKAYTRLLGANHGMTRAAREKLK